KDLQAVFFEVWWRAHPEAEFQPVPADLVTTSGSGLDPHITLKGAQYQVDRVAAAWGEKKAKENGTLDQERVKQELRKLLDEKKHAPLGGLAGVELVNVLEVNLELPGRIDALAKAK